jgi:two-component system, sensor histidine kinase
MPPSLPLVAPNKRERALHNAREWFLRFGPYGSVLLGLSAVLLIWFGTIYFVESEKLQTERAARENAANLSRAFVEDIIRSIRAVDQTLLYVRDSYARDPQHFDISLWSRNRQFLSDFNFQVSIVGKDGIMIASNIPGAKPGVDLSDREHFRVQVQNRADTLFISKPVLGRVSHKWSIQFTRRIIMPDGSFGGVVVVSVDPEYLSQLYRSIDVGQEGVVALVGSDGIVRARGSSGPSEIGESVASGSLLKAYAAARDGFFTKKSPLDGVDRIYAYRAVTGYPLIVAVGLAMDELFALHEKNRRTDIAIAALLTVWLLAVTFLIFLYQRNLASARDAAEAGTRARSEFLAMMSHELRTPMNGVVGMADLLLDTRLDDEQKVCTTTLRESASYLLRIINDVLDFSKLDAGRVEVEKIRFDVCAMVRDSAALLATTIKEKGLRLALDVAPDVPRHVVGDPGRLRQVLLNLIGNAVKFTKAGQVAISVALDPAPPPGKVRLNFTVADTGIGIPPDGIPLLFREFSQLDSSIARRFGGTGLGLAICKRLITLMGGTIGVESEVGKGTTFRFTLDYLPAAPTAAESRDVEALQLSPPLVPVEAPDPGSIRVLLVEDNKTNQLVASKLIRRFGFALDIANNGHEALAACTATKYDLVFMDVMMPEMDGLAATKAIRALPPPNCKPYIIALTAMMEREDKDHCLEAGMDDYLVKPVTRSALAQKLNEFLARAAPAQQPSAASAPPARQQNADGSVHFDESIFGELADALGSEDVRNVVELFLSDTDRRLAVMRGAAKSGDNACVKREIHSLKSSVANLGFLRLSALALALERDALGLNWPALLARLNAIEREFADVKALATARLIGRTNTDQPIRPERGEVHAG